MITVLQAKINVVEENIGKGNFFSPLEKKISYQVKTNVTFVGIEFQENRVSLISLNLVKKAGVMSSVFSELYVSTFGSDYIEKTNTLWLSISFRWQFEKGGSNGTQILEAVYGFNTNVWGFRT